MLKGSRGISKDFVKKSMLEKIWANLPIQISSRKVMASPPTITVGAAATLSESWPTTGYSGGASGKNNVSGEYFTFVKARNIEPIADGGNSITARNILITLDPVTYSRSNIGMIFNHIGSNIEFFLDHSGKALFKIDGEYVSLTPTTITGGQYVKLAFGSSKIRKIELIYNQYIGAVYTDATDTITKVKSIGPSVCILGDSFAIGTGLTNTGLESFPILLSDYLEWDDIVYSARGGSGYLANTSGTYTNYGQRIQHDVIDNGYEVVIFTGGYNDANESKSYNDVYAECIDLFSKTKAGLPESLIIAFSPFWIGGPGTETIKLRNVWTAIKDAANATGIIYIDILEMDLPQDPSPDGLLTANILAGATSFISSTFYAPKTTVLIDNIDRVTIGSVSGTYPGPWTHTIYEGTIKTAHSIGGTISQVGRGILTGSGRVGATTGKGNADVCVQNDAVHPTLTGQELIAQAIANQIKKYFRGFY